MLKVASLRKVCRLFFDVISLVNVKMLIRPLREKEGKSRGFTLVEVLAVIVILGILAASAVVSVAGVIEKAKKDVCDANVLELERHYEAYLVLEGIDHSDVVFAEFLRGYDGSICPVGGDMGYMDGEVECSVHSIDEEDEGEDVPFL